MATSNHSHELRYNHLRIGNWAGILLGAQVGLLSLIHQTVVGEINGYNIRVDQQKRCNMAEPTLHGGESSQHYLILLRGTSKAWVNPILYQGVDWVVSTVWWVGWMCLPAEQQRHQKTSPKQSTWNMPRWVPYEPATGTIRFKTSTRSDLPKSNYTVCSIFRKQYFKSHGVHAWFIGCALHCNESPYMTTNHTIWYSPKLVQYISIYLKYLTNLVLVLPFRRRLYVIMCLLVWAGNLWRTTSRTC